MALPDVGVIDTMINIPHGSKKDWYKFLEPQLKDSESKDDFEFPVEYMFKGVPDDLPEDTDPVEFILGEMDRFGIDIGMVGIAAGRDVSIDGTAAHPDRFVTSFEIDPHAGMEGVRDLEWAVKEHGAIAATFFPAGKNPQVPINDKKVYPFYAKCVELDIPIFVCAGIPGPRVGAACQHVMLIDEVCWDFPELTFVTRHGCEPWEDLAVKLMLKWPNLYYSTSAFAPKYYPQAIIDYANTRGADKIIYAGYFPMGLSLERIFAELPHIGLKDEVWPKFLRHNAARVLGID
ncbi:MAG: amidohydrolase family protein [Acidimicrobiales bacterium]|nr:amidohydrolase family protein [Acidimicrobiales bacterium]